MNNSVRRVKGLGEVSIRVRDLGAMHKFYEEVVGLEVLPTGGCARRDESFVFFKIARVMAAIPRISPSLKHLTQCFLITRLYN